MTALKPLQAPQAPPVFADAMARASRSTGTSFEFLVQTAWRESRFETNAKAPTSSATGPFQFIERTWLEVMKKQGPALGYGKLAQAIVRQKNGHYTIPDPDMRRQVLNLRKDPAIAADMTAAYAQMNRDYLEKALGRKVSSGEVYIAHFLGPSGAKRFLRALQATPEQPAAAHFPAAAKANRPVFYNGKRQMLSLQQVYDQLTRGFAPKTEVAATQPPQPASHTAQGALQAYFAPVKSHERPAMLAAYTGGQLIETGERPSPLALHDAKKVRGLFAAPRPSPHALRQAQEGKPFDLIALLKVDKTL